jgi:hypothetical protein
MTSARLSPSNAFKRRAPVSVPLVATVLLVAPLAGSPATPPLHERIDRAIESTFVGPVLPRAGDADFGRRVHLDLAGRIPSPEETRRFFADTSPDKRAQLVDRLLGSREFARHLATTFDVMLMERRPERSVKVADWQQWLFDSFATNKPWDRLAREILGADGTDERIRAAARFHLDREGEANLLTRDTGRLFLGRDMGCAQCHDHPRIDDYVQRDYHGLYAFFSRAYLFTEDRTKKNFLAEKAEGDVTFTSVFTKESGGTRPRLPGGSQLDEPRFRMGSEWTVRPDAKDKNLRPVPKHSRIAELARVATDGSNPAFNRNIANRLWAHMMGRGLVEPVDEMHSDNPPAYPELLDLLAAEFVAMKFDVRAFLGELALTRTYQRSIELNASPTLPPKPAAGQMAGLETARQRLSDELARHDELHKQALASLAALKKTNDPVFAEFAKTNAALAEMRKACEPAINAQFEAQKLLATRNAALESIQQALASVTNALANLPNDKDLTNSASSLRTRADALVKEVDAAAKDADAKVAAAKPMFEKLAAADEAADAIRERHTAAERQVLDLEREFTGLIARRQAVRTQLRHAERQLADAKTITETEPLFIEAQAARASADGLRVRTAEARRAIAAHDALDAASQELVKANAELRDSRRMLAEAAATRRGCTPATPEELAKLRQVVASREAAAGIARMRVAEAQRAFVPFAKSHDAARRDLPDLERSIGEAARQASALRARLVAPVSKLTPLLETRFASAPLVALSPEQLCWSMMQATGQIRAQEAAADAEFEKKDPLTESNRDSASRLAARAAFIEQFVWDKLKGNVPQFVSLFGNAAGQPQDAFYASTDQALFFNNGGLVRGWLAPANGNLTDRLLKAPDSAALAEELYLAVLARPPTSDEVKEVEKRLAARASDKTTAVQDIAWALLTSVEFRFKH